MTNKFIFEEKEKFLHKLEEVVRSGVASKDIRIFTPYPVHEGTFSASTTSTPSATLLKTILNVFSDSISNLY